MNNILTNRRQFLYSLGAMGFLGAGYMTASKFASAKTQEISQTKILMGTFVSISARNEDYSVLEDALQSAFTTVANAEKVFSRHNSSSPLAVLNAQGKVDNAPKELIELVKTSVDLARLSNNSFNPAIVPSLQALESYNVAQVSSLSSAVQKDLAILSNPQNIQIDSTSIRLAHTGMAISLDGIAKGHIADLAALALEEKGVYDYMINAGGDIRLHSPVEGEAWTIAIQDAKDKTKRTQMLSMRSGAIATSANYDSVETKGYNHLIGDSVNTLSLTAIAPTCQEADALATLLFAMSEQERNAFIAHKPSYSYTVQGNSANYYSPNWQA